MEVKQKYSNKRKKLLLLGVIAVALVAVGCFLGELSNKANQDEKQKIQEEIDQLNQELTNLKNNNSNNPPSNNPPTNPNNNKTHHQITARYLSQVSDKHEYVDNNNYKFRVLIDKNNKIFSSADNDKFTLTPVNKTPNNNPNQIDIEEEDNANGPNQGPTNPQPQGPGPQTPLQSPHPQPKKQSVNIKLGNPALRGPPYANGKLHIGHFLNFLIKDIIVRFQASQGNYTPLLLGWDAHGLPTEHKMLQVYQDKKVDLRPVCHQFALEQAQIQKEQLKELGLFTDYEKYYITLNKNYEAEQLRIFGEMVKKNLIYQGYRPIHWSCGHETALAEAEIEYYEKKDTSLYFKIKLVDNFFANQLAAIKKTASYALVREKLLGLNYFHPYCKDKKGYIVDGSDFIEEKEGTGIVHLAPAFGMEDFSTAKKEKLIIECPLEPNGYFNEKIGIPEIINKHYSEVNIYIINGVPIPVLYKNNEPILNPEIIDYVAEIVASRETILGQDIMDVWLDSGVSHWCVLRREENDGSLTLFVEVEE
ncbi:11113_t:CDS:10, partial [Diversispora eburnea]